MKAPFSVYALKVLSPGLLIVAVMAVFKRIFSGTGNDGSDSGIADYRTDHQCSCQYCRSKSSFSEWEVVRERRREKSC